MFEFNEPLRPLIEGRHYYIVHLWISEKGFGTLVSADGDAYHVRATDLHWSCNGCLERNEIVSAKLVSPSRLEEVVVEEGPRAVMGSSACAIRAVLELQQGFEPSLFQ